MPPRNKDPNKPKGRTSAYAFFVQDRREMYKEKDMQIQFSSFSKECASLWKDMNEDDKAKYVKQAEADRKRYQREMANYNPPDDQDTPQKKRRKKKDPRMPKRSM